METNTHLWTESCLSAELAQHSQGCTSTVAGGSENDYSIFAELLPNESTTNIQHEELLNFTVTDTEPLAI